MMNSSVALASQPTSVLVALWRHMDCPVDRGGTVTSGAMAIIRLLHGRGYPLGDLLSFKRLLVPK